MVENMMYYLPPLKELDYLPGPYEILETMPCVTYKMLVLKWEIGKIDISPRWVGAPPIKTVHTIRVYTTPEWKPTFPHYWDITPRRLVAALYALFKTRIPPDKVLEIHRDVAGPKAHFSVRWVSP